MRRSSSTRLSAKRLGVTLAVLLIVLFIVLYIGLANQQQETIAPARTEAVKLSVTVIDVGQGDSILLAFDSGETMLIDAGAKSGVSDVIEAIDAQGLDGIDILVATHPHADHIGGMRDIIERFKIGAVYMPDFKSSSKTYKELMETIEAHGIPLNYAHAGLDFPFGPALCTVVSPQEGANKDANNASVVIFLDYAETDFLFTGDMEAWAEAMVLKSGYAVDAEVLKVAHHGSRSSTSEEFLDAVSPVYAVISCGTGNSYGHPHEETLALLDEYGIITYRTDLSGNVLMVADGENLTVTLDR